jgi:thiol-disulfide isomerase/thioredoxin
MLKKILISIFLVILFFIPGFNNLALAQGNEVNLYFFWSKSCPHCAEEKVFLNKIAPAYPKLIIHDYEVSGRFNALLLQEIGRQLKIATGGVPITIIGGDYFVGYYNDRTTGKTIIELYEKYAKEGDPDLVGVIIRELEGNQNTHAPTETPLPNPTTKPLTVTQVPTITPVVIDEDNIDKNIQIPEQINVPVLGSINIKDLSLPVLAIVLGGWTDLTLVQCGYCYF